MMVILRFFQAGYFDEEAATSLVVMVPDCHPANVGSISAIVQSTRVIGGGGEGFRPKLFP